MSKSSAILVIGGDGMLGARVVDALRTKGHRVIATTRRTAPSSSDLVTLDLAKQSGPINFGTPITNAFLCAGITSIQACAEQPSETQVINVTHPIEILSPLMKEGTRVTILSTNQVFDGSIPATPAQNPCSPQTEYGKQKVELESWLLDQPEGNHTIARLTKVLGKSTVLFEKWVTELKKRQSINAFTDMCFAPVLDSQVTDALTRVPALSYAPPFLQISATKDISYFEAAKFIAKRIGANEELVQPTSAADCLPQGTYIPKNTSLAPEDWERIMNITAPHPTTTLDETLG